MSYPKFRRNISGYDKTIGNLFIKNRDYLLESKDIMELKDKITKLFNENSMTSPKAKQILFKLEGPMSFNNALMYVQNIIFAASGMATY